VCHLLGIPTTIFALLRQPTYKKLGNIYIFKLKNYNNL